MTSESGRSTTRREAGEILSATLVTAMGSTATAASALAAASDIDPQSGNRLPLPRREDLDAEAQRVFDDMANPKGGTLRGLRGPAGIYLHSPKLAPLLRPLNDYLRNGSGISGRVRETAILAVARGCDNQFEWAAHEAEARRQGVPSDVIEVIRHRKPTTALDAADSVIIDLCRASLDAHRVPSDLYARALKQFGKQQLVDLIMLMGYYVMAAGLLTTFDMQLDAGVAPPLPMP
jgi:4-carboxymuconolactone decarboxylase